MSHLVAGDAERAQVLQVAEATALVDGADVVGVPGVPFQALTHQLLRSRREAAPGKFWRQLCQPRLPPRHPVPCSLLDHSATHNVLLRRS